MCISKLFAFIMESNYSQACIKRSPLGQIESGFLRQVTS
jgi:hypothetical protein